MPLIFKGTARVKRSLVGVIAVTLDFGHEPVAGKCVLLAVIDIVKVVPGNTLKTQTTFGGILTKLINIRGLVNS